MTTIRSESEALELLQKLLTDDAIKLDISGVEFEGWPRFTIRIKGKDFDGTVPTRVMPTFLQLQKLINKTYCQSSYGTDNLRKLTKDDKEALELVVKVEKGSSFFDAVMDSALTKLIEHAGSKMTPEQITLVAIVFSLMIGSTFMWRSYQHRKVRELELDQEVQLSNVEKEKMQLISEGMQKIATISSKQAEVLESVSDVRDELLTRLKPEDDLFINPNEEGSEDSPAVSISGKDAQNLVRKPRETAVERMVTDDFHLLSADFSSEDRTRFVVERGVDKYQFRADVPIGVLDNDQMTRLRDNSWDRVEVRMTLLVRELNGKYTSAKVTSVY